MIEQERDILSLRERTEVQAIQLFTMHTICRRGEARALRSLVPWSAMLHIGGGSQRGAARVRGLELCQRGGKKAGQRMGTTPHAGPTPRVWGGPTTGAASAGAGGGPTSEQRRVRSLVFPGKKGIHPPPTESCLF
jgi:hypothetical protein